ncbi:MAG: hydroxymethylbilane synthase [Chloroflexota bacterium]
MKIIIGTRTSNLAMWQTRHIQAKLTAAWAEITCEIRPYSTKGDETQKLDQPLPEIGGKGLFTEALENGLKNGEIDIAVHSLKDLPVDQNNGIILGAIVGREDARDGLVTADPNIKLGNLPVGAVVGTGSLRRQAQLLEMRPDLQVRSIRGNVETRIQKVLDGRYDATILALAGVKRLGISDQVSQIFPLDVLLPAPGQGAMGVQCREEDSETRRLLNAIHQQEVEACTTAERTFLHTLQGGCATPVGAYAQFDRWEIHLQGLVGAPDGSKIIRVEHRDVDPQKVATAVAKKAVAQGANALLFDS